MILFLFLWLSIFVQTKEECLVFLIDSTWIVEDTFITKVYFLSIFVPLHSRCPSLFVCVCRSIHTLVISLSIDSHILSPNDLNIKTAYPLLTNFDTLFYCIVISIFTSRLFDQFAFSRATANKLCFFVRFFFKKTRQEIKTKYASMMK